MLDTTVNALRESRSAIDRANFNASHASRREGPQRRIDNSALTMDETGEAKRLPLPVLGVDPALKPVRVRNPLAGSYRVWVALGMPPDPVFAPKWWRKYAYDSRGIRLSALALSWVPKPLWCRE